MASSNPDRIRQGDILRDVDLVESIANRDGIVNVGLIRFPFVYVLSQDCDLEQHDFTARGQRNNEDKLLISALIAPLYSLSHLFSGEHLTRLQMKMSAVQGDTAKNFIKTNANPRYHHLDFDDSTAIEAAVIDFKHTFSMSIGLLSAYRAQHFVCSVGELYREDISQRFAAYLSRIGTPRPKISVTT